MHKETPKQKGLRFFVYQMCFLMLGLVAGFYAVMDLFTNQYPLSIYCVFACVVLYCVTEHVVNNTDEQLSEPTAP